MGRPVDHFCTTNEIGKGTGLGLSTWLAMVRSNGGFLRAGKPGKGTASEVSLPARADISAETPTERVVELPRGNGELIFVVGDEFSVRLVTQYTLEAFGSRRGCRRGRGVCPNEPRRKIQAG